MEEKSNNKDLYVSEISFDADEDELRKLFVLCGTVRSIHMITDRRTGERKGCAYVRMASAGEAKDALNTLDGTLLINRCIRVRMARPKNAPAPVAETSPEKPQRSNRPRGRRK